mmetsp:Transcript_33276/g.100544  ORF Transcript_33276/g.100544 Transcript_33276/m.100544 type:complete len:184 (-) Transcript_33276:3-554(-)
MHCRPSVEEAEVHILFLRFLLSFLLRSLGSGITTARCTAAATAAADDDDDAVSSSDEDIPTIANLDEEAKVDLETQVADAEHQQVKVPMLAALDKDVDLVSTMPLMSMVSNYMQHHKIDLKLLTKSLNSSRMISEADEPWTNLFHDVKAELQAEIDAKEALETADDEYEADGIAGFGVLPLVK